MAIAVESLQDGSTFSFMSQERDNKLSLRTVATWAPTDSNKKLGGWTISTARTAKNLNQPRSHRSQFQSRQRRYQHQPQHQQLCPLPPSPVFAFLNLESLFQACESPCLVLNPVHALPSVDLLPDLPPLLRLLSRQAQLSLSMTFSRPLLLPPSSLPPLPPNLPSFPPISARATLWSHSAG